MKEEDIKTIEQANGVKEYCKNHTDCIGCVFARENDCTMINSNPCDWELPPVKTYKEKFLEIFPNANIEMICRADVFGDVCQRIYDDTTETRCVDCWNEMYTTYHPSDDE